MVSHISPAVRMRGNTPRILMYGLLVAFSAFLWLLLIAFHWEVSLRAREVEYFGARLFPVRSQVVPLPVLYATGALLTLTSTGVIIWDRKNRAIRFRLQALLGQILESLETGVVVIDRSGMLTLANDSARQVLPRIPSESIGVSFLDTVSEYHEIREVARSALEQEKYVRQVEQSLGSGDNQIPVRITTLPLKDRHKRTIGTLLLVDDVREVAAMERQMRAADRLSSLGTLAATLAHEIRNPLAAMKLNLELLDRSLGTPDSEGSVRNQRERYLRIMDSEVSRLTGVVETFLSFARPSRSVQGRVLLSDVLRLVVELVENQARSRNIVVALDPGGSSAAVQGSADQLKQAFLNIVINSLEAMTNGGHLTIRIDARRDAGPEPAETVTIRFEDTGEGIPPERIGLLFEPFFSTRPRGTGLGLTIARQAIEDHRGRISVESTVGRGTVVVVDLPQTRPEGSERSA